MDHYSDSTNGFPSINIKSTAAVGGRVTSWAKMNQLFLPQLNYTVTVPSEERAESQHKKKAAREDFSV